MAPEPDAWQHQVNEAITTHLDAFLRPREWTARQGSGASMARGFPPKGA